MDVVGILKEAWAVTRRHKALWVLGLFVGGSAGVSTVNWQMDSRDWQGRTLGDGDWQSLTLHPETERFANEVEAFFESGVTPDWLPWVFVGIGALILIGLLMLVLSVAATGGLIDQTNGALAGRDVSLRAGWRAGFRRWGRVFAVRLLLALPVILVGGLVAALVGGATVFYFASGGEPAAGLLGLGALVPFAVIAMIGLGVLVSLLREVSLRHAVLGDESAVASIKAAWDDLVGRRGVATMWLVILVVGIGVGVAAGIVMIPLVVMAGLVTGASVIMFELAGL